MHTGSVLIYFTLALSALTLLFLAKSASGNVFAKVTAQRMFYLSSIIITFAVILLFQAFLGNDFSITYVYQHSSFDLPILYRFSAFWAGQEGGFLLWLFFLSIIGIVLILSRDENESILMSLIIITQVFILIHLSIKNPFARLWETFPDQFTRTLPMFLDGRGLNPLLQDFWMAIHPPVLFAGYAASVVPFAYAVAALLKQDYTVMPKKAYRWVIFTVAALGLGIFLGGYWAYAVLGWGGYWGWDPVENSSLIPWLLLIALMHGIILQNRKGALVRTNLVLAMASFILVLYSTYLTRSGVLANFSVHSFAGDTVSHQLLYYILFFIIIGAALLVMRARSITTKSLDGTLLSSTNLLFYCIVLLILYTIMISLGTSMPIISGIFTENASTVTEDFYNTWSIPVALLLLSFIAIGAFYRGGTLKKATLAVIVSVSVAAGVLFNLFHTTHPSAYLLSAFGIFTILAIALDWMGRRGGGLMASRLAHIGVALLILGVVASGLHSTSINKRLLANTEESAGSIRIKFLGITNEDRSKLMFTLTERRSIGDIAIPYFFSDQTNSIYKEPHIRPGILGDLYITPLSYLSGKSAAASLELREGEVKALGDVEVRYLGLKDINMKSMMAGKAEIFINLEVKQGRTSWRISPGLRMSPSKELESVDAFFSAKKRKIAIHHLERGTGKVHLFVEPNPDSPLPPDEVIVEIAWKRLIILVWLGTGLIALGFFISLRRVF